MKFKLVEKLLNKEIILYHNTNVRNAKSIKEHGLKVASSDSELASGYQMTWATSHPSKDDAYGGTTIEFVVKENQRCEKVNDDQYIIYDDIPANQILTIDYLLTGAGAGFMHTSEVDNYIEEYGKEAVKRVLTRRHNDELTMDEIKRLTPQLDWE